MTSSSDYGWQDSDYTVSPGHWTQPRTYGQPLTTTSITTLPDVVRDKKGRSTLTRDERVKNKMRLIEALGDEVAKLKARPTEPDEDNAVVSFTKTFGGAREYNYAAIKAGDDKWYITGAASPQGLSWDQLIDFIEESEDEAQLSKADKWKTLK